MDYIKKQKGKEIRLGIIYTIGFTIAYSLINLFQAKIGFEKILKEPWVTFAFLMVWTSFYIPLIVYFKKPGYKIKTLGIHSYGLNQRILMLTFAIVAMTLVYLEYTKGFSIRTFSEGYARTGEEFLIRGFLYALLLQTFSEKKRPWVWAIIASAVIFSVIHTHHYFGGNSIDFDALNMIIQASLILGVIRQVTKSILPCILFHCIGNQGLTAGLVGILIYLALAIICERREAKVNIAVSPSFE